MRARKAGLRSPAVSLALVVAAATATATTTVAASVLRLRWAWPPRIQPLVEATAVPDSGWGAPWESLAGSPAVFQQEALQSLIQTLAILAGAVVLVAGLSLGLSWLCCMMDQWPGLATRSALGATLAHLFRAGAYPLLGLTGLGAVSGLFAGAVIASALHGARPESLSHSGGFVGAAVGAALMLTVACLAALSGVVMPLLFRLSRGTAGLGRVTGDRATRSRGVARVQTALAALQVAAVLLVCAVCALIISATKPAALRRAGAQEDARTIVPLQLVGPGARSALARSSAYERLLDTARDRGLSPLNVTSPGAWLGLGKRLSVQGFCNNCFSGTDFVAVSSTGVRVIAAGPGSLRPMASSISGREFTARDTVRAPRVAVLSDLAANQLFPRADPVGKTVRLGIGPDTDYTVVGVVRPVVTPGLGSGGDTLPIVYLSLLQHPPSEVEVSIDRGQMGILRAAVDSFTGGGPRLALQRPEPLQVRRGAALAPLKWFRALFVGLGLAATVLSVCALATQMTATVTARLRELALRLAVGARPYHIVTWVVPRTLRTVGVGFLLGATGARAAEEFLRPHLSAGPVGDLSLVISLSIPLGLMAMVASVIPAVRASRVDPAAIWRELRTG